MSEDLSRFSAAEIIVDLDALARNTREIQSRAASPIAAVVKANAYGLGMDRIAPVLVSAGVTSFFVATLEEGCKLRELLGPETGRIAVFEGPCRDSLPIYARYRLTPVLNDAEQLACCANWPEDVVVHVDTAMNRLGFAEPALKALVRDGRFKAVRVGLLMSHLACADTPDAPSNADQLERFKRLLLLFPGAQSSLANSAGVLLGESFVSDLPRIGIALYGGEPAAPGTAFEPVVSLRARVLAVRSVAAGESVGYGATFAAKDDTTIAVLGVGYADGLPRQASNKARLAFGAERLPLVGRVSMDFCTVDIGQCASPPVVDDWVEVFGASAPVAELALAADTIDYTIFTGLSRRPRWRYVSGDNAG